MISHSVSRILAELAYWIGLSELRSVKVNQPIKCIDNKPNQPHLIRPPRLKKTPSYQLILKIIVKVEVTPISSHSKLRTVGDTFGVFLLRCDLFIPLSLWLSAIRHYAHTFSPSICATGRQCKEYSWKDDNCTSSTNANADNGTSNQRSL